ncbi:MULTISPECIES: ABC transporter substrate-binding protein [unclassified Streptomyces]|uniref:ABC transporter substrate-binding protein n=1 Tax=unclassified Streptomyces TaxID=2593676 RepID=UPI00225C3AD7|nr:MULTISPECIES: ABC transporter substrate-binding protein [unclassified Streptomyces]MCX4862924.1 ABC transporter substrate-binding protein [Streptomyces sp. NBC_00906]MCX4894161.1 ABC transporter substrate-binding protein [Streptomyces sp. NBC_00892]
MGLDDVLAQLTFRERFTRKRVRFERRYGALVVQVEGAPAPVRQWLGALLRNYRGVVPVNNPSDVPAGQDEEGLVVEQLQAMTEGCGYGGRVAHGLPIVFPRFAAARTALYEWQPVATQSHPRQIGDLKRQIREAITEERRQTLPELRPRLNPLLDDPYVSERMGGGLVGLLLKVVNALRFPHHRTVRWYGTRRFPRQRTFEAVCEELERLRSKPAAAKQLLLVEALLADIDAHYGAVRRLNRARRPVLLLPDVDTVDARRVIRDRLMEAYDGESRALRVYPVVVTTSQPGGATPTEGAKPAAAAAALAEAIEERFGERVRVAEERSRGGRTPLPSRLVQVTLDDAPDPQPGRRPGRRILGPVTAVVTALALAAAVLGTYYGFFREPESCGNGLQVHGEECLGVSDGSGVFMPAYDGMPEVFARIAEQNKAVAAAKHATVALLIPMESDNPAVQRQILSEIQGAYLAQAGANGVDSAKPPIRLVLANPGKGYGEWRSTVDQLRRQEPELRAVVGFNLSVTKTKEALTYVTNTLKLPAVASVVTADDFSNPEGKETVPFPGLARAVSTTKDQARALLAFDPQLAGAETALVTDDRPGDDYNRSLRDAFADARAGKAQGGVQDMRFESPDVEEAGVTPNEFEDFAGNICRSNAHVIYFAGRALHLKLFVNKLATTYCREKKSYTVITGSDATTLDQRLDDRHRALLQGDPGSGKPSVTIRYAAPAHPDAWSMELRKWQQDPKHKGQQPPLYLREAKDAMDTLRQSITDQAGTIGDVYLDDGRTIVTYDVVLTASRALARAVHTSGQEVPSADRIRKDLGKLNADLRVRGAGGWICLTNAGNPYNKALSVVHLEPGSKRLTFEGVAWPTGRAPAQEDDCVIPAHP